MRDPLLLPVTAVISGILLGNWGGLSVHDAAWPTAAFLLLAIPARSTWLRQLCMGLALTCTGLLAEAWHRPGPPPEIDAGFKRRYCSTAASSSPPCSHPAASSSRWNWRPAARARVSLCAWTIPNRPCRSWITGSAWKSKRASAARTITIIPGGFDYTAYLARQNIFWTATMARGIAGARSSGALRVAILGVVYGLRTAALERLDQLYAGDKYSTGMMEAMLIGESSEPGTRLD